MGRWGETEDQDFIATLTNDFSNNEEVALLPQVQQFILYLDYTKGSESSLEIKLEYALQWNTPKVFYQESIMDIGSQIVTPYVITISVSGKYRIPLPVGIQEDQIKISVRGVGSVAAPGSVTLDFTVDKYVTP